MKRRNSYNFYEVLQVLYYFFEQECRETKKSENVKYFNDIKRRIVQLAADLGNSAYLDNWYDKTTIKDDLKELVEYNERQSWYRPKKNVDKPERVPRGKAHKNADA